MFHKFSAHIIRSTRIIGGTAATIADFPWQVSLQLVDPDSDSFHYCGGTIIGHNSLLTAAHCVRASGIHIPANKILARIGSTNNTAGGSVQAIGRILVHPEFNDSNWNNDIAIVFFANSIEYSKNVQSIELPGEQFELANNDSVSLSGWGVSDEDQHGDDAPDVLQAVDLNVIDQQMCADAYNKLSYLPPITNNMFCAGVAIGGKGPCRVRFGSIFDIKV